jgi:hypothetical protein
MPASHPFALLALGAALVVCACNARSQPGRAPETSLACTSPSDTACGPDAYCKAAGAPEGGGRCAPKPRICPMIYHPVCGADGRTYPNACHAERAGVNLAHGGACESGASPLSAAPAPSRSPGPSSKG